MTLIQKIIEHAFKKHDTKVEVMTTDLTHDRIRMAVYRLDGEIITGRCILFYYPNTKNFSSYYSGIKANIADPDFSDKLYNQVIAFMNKFSHPSPINK